MAVKKKSPAKSRVNKSASVKKSGFKFHWWMALILVMAVAVIGIVIIQFSNAGTLSVNAPVTKNKQGALNNAFTQCSQRYGAPPPSHPLPYFPSYVNADSKKNWQIDLNLNNNERDLVVIGNAPNEGAVSRQNSIDCYNYARKFLNVVLNDSSLAQNSNLINSDFTRDIYALRITINKLLDIRYNACQKGDRASCDALNYFKGLGMVDGEYNIPINEKIDPQLWSWINFFTYLYLVSTPVN